MEVKGKRVFVGLSGGVDSAVSAALLKKAGAQVVGVFIKGWYPPGMPCTWAEDRRDAMRAAAHLAIPFETLDASAEYKKEVIDYLLAEYAAGRTPNPDVMCNREIKFGTFYRYAKAHGADYLATGHYRSGEKDQTYFLALVPREILKETIFPVARLDKSETRRLAKRFGLPQAEKKDSQGVCFLGSISVKEFLEKEFGDNPAILHTIGERVVGKFVSGKDVAKGTIELSESRTPIGKTILFHSCNVLAHEAPDRAQYRYRGPVVMGSVEGERFIAAENLPEYPAPGQLIAFYRGEECVGGAIISA